MVTWTWPGCGSAWTTPTPKMSVKIPSGRPRAAAGHAGFGIDPAACRREVLPQLVRMAGAPATSATRGPHRRWRCRRCSPLCRGGRGCRGSERISRTLARCCGQLDKRASPAQAYCGDLRPVSTCELTGTPGCRPRARGRFAAHFSCLRSSCLDEPERTRRRAGR